MNAQPWRRAIAIGMCTSNIAAVFGGYFGITKPPAGLVVMIAFVVPLAFMSPWRRRVCSPGRSRQISAFPISGQPEDCRQMLVRRRRASWISLLDSYAMSQKQHELRKTVEHPPLNHFLDQWRGYIQRKGGNLVSWQFFCARQAQALRSFGNRVSSRQTGQRPERRKPRFSVSPAQLTSCVCKGRSSPEAPMEGRARCSPIASVSI